MHMKMKDSPKRRRRCLQGTIRRKAYTTKNGVYVKSTCVKDMGKPGKTPKKDRVLPELKPGKLSSYGYSTFVGVRKRHDALKAAIEDDGYLKILRRLVAVSNYNKRSAPEAHAIMRKDIEWMQAHRDDFSE